MKRQTMNITLFFTKICTMLIGISVLTTLPVKITAQTATYTGLQPGTFMKHWLVLGPIPVFHTDSTNKDIDAQKAVFEQEFLPVEEYESVIEGKSENISGMTYQWKYIDSDDNMVDLDILYNRVDFAVSYACADIAFARSEKVLFGIGSDDGIKIWLNGKLVHQNWVGRAVNQDDDLVTLNMKKGNNRLIIKVQEMQGEWGFCCRFIGKDEISEHFLTAVREGNSDRIRMLIENGADVNAKNVIGFTPYHIARIYQQSTAVRCLIDFGADTTTNMPTPAEPGHIPEYLDRLVPKLMALYKVPGVSIVGIENRKLAWDRQYGVLRAGGAKKVDRNTIFEACSMSKPVLAYLALKLVEQGKLELDRPLIRYLDEPYLENQLLHEQITARMVLSHTSGFPNWRPGGWQSGNPLIVGFEPGTQFGYSGEGYLYLQRVVEHITGIPYCQYVDENLFKPLGLILSSHEWQDRYRDIYAVSHNAQGQAQPENTQYHFDTAVSAYSLYCTPTEYAQFIVEILKTDRSAAHSLNTQSLDLMFTRTSNTGWKPIPRSDSMKNDTLWYGLGWALERTSGGDRMSHGGSNGSTFRQMCYTEFNPTQGTGIVIMTNAIGGYPLYREVIALATPTNSLAEYVKNPDER